MRHALATAAFATLAMCAAPAFAHAFLKTAIPAVGSSLPQAPAAVTITFTEGVEPLFSTITVKDAAGGQVDDGHVHAAGDDTRLAIGLKTLSAGIYTVAWHATSTDAHKTSGKFNFTIKP